MSFSLRLSLSGICLLTLLAASAPSRATTLSVTDGDESASLLSQGWTETSPGIWERFNLEGQQETFVSSAEGLRSILPSLREQAKQRFEAYLAKPTAQNQRAYEEHKALVDAVAANLQTPASSKQRLAAESGDKAAASCTRNFSYGATTGRFHCIDWADASASYSVSNAVTCPELCTVHAYAYSSMIDCFEGTPYSENQSCTLTGTNVSCSAYASGGFGSSCYFYGFASIHCPALSNLYLSQSANQTTCQCSC